MGIDAECSGDLQIRCGAVSNPSERVIGQGTHNGVALFSVTILLAQIAGIDLSNLSDRTIGSASPLRALAASDTVGGWVAWLGVPWWW